MCHYKKYLFFHSILDHNFFSFQILIKKNSIDKGMDKCTNGFSNEKIYRQFYDQTNGGRDKWMTQPTESYLSFSHSAMH